MNVTSDFIITCSFTKAEAEKLLALLQPKRVSFDEARENFRTKFIELLSEHLEGHEGD